MIAVGGVPVPIVHVVDVAIVRHGLVATIGPVQVLVVVVRQVWQRVLVIVPLVWRVRVALVHIVDVPLALHAGVTTAGPVLVVVMRLALMGVVVGGGHWSSLLC
jgi:hypothetical protein